MPETYNSKVVLSSGEVLIDLTADTITAADLASGVTAHGKDGAPIVGTNTYDSDTSEDTAAVGEILFGKTAHARGAALTGTMPNNNAVAGKISTVAGVYTVPQGYHDGSGTVDISASEQAKIIPGNIKAGVDILGVEGTYGGEEIKATTATVAPSFSRNDVDPPEGFDYLTRVTVAAIPVVYTDNAAGGKTVTIG